MQSKKLCPSNKFFYVLFPVTQSLFLLGLSWSPENITASNKKSTSKKKPTSVSKITMQYFHKNILIPLLFQCELFIQHVFLKIQLCLKMLFFTSSDITWYSHKPKNSSFLSFYSFLVNFSENHRGSVRECNWQRVTKLNGVKNAIMEVTYFLNDLMFNLLYFCLIVSYWEKVTSYEKFSHNFKIWKNSAF